MSVASAGDEINSGNKEVFVVNIIDDTDVTREQIKNYIFFDGIIGKNPMTISDDNKNGIIKGIQYWADILAPNTTITHPAQFFVAGIAKEKNAYAGFYAFDKGSFTIQPYFEEYLQGLRDLNDVNILKFETGADKKIYENGQLVDNGAYGTIMLGQYMGAKREGSTDGWWMKGNAILPDNEQAADGVAMIRHEVGHSLGIISQVNVETDKDGNPVVDKDGTTVYYFPVRLGKNNTYADHVYDQNLNRSQPNQLIITSKEFERRQAADPTLKPSDFFILDNKLDDKFKSDNPRSGNAYFIGDNVSKVLNGRTFDGVDGLPLRTWETNTDEKVVLDLGHFGLNSLMSHNEYRNMTIFNEVELAALQDIGYNFDRRAHFGYSIYNDNLTFTNTNGYSARNSAGSDYINEYSTIPFGVGLHIYGTNNDITQAANVFTMGNGAVGIWVSGTDNKLTLAQGYEIHADGEDGVGVLVSYGGNQVFNQQGTVTANGQKGSGVRFDFGSNMLGADEIYCGSYIYYDRDVEDQGTITTAKNVKYNDKKDMDNYAPELGAPLISEYNLSGSLSGGANAIYIGKNAFVHNINVNSGAHITGNITSDWKHFGASVYEGAYYRSGAKRDLLRIQYNGKMEKNGYEYYKYIPDLVTNLNVNTDLKYDEDINGADNMKLNVNAGTMIYGGTANVVNVNVAKEAALLGGSFTVNDMTSSMAEGFSDGTTGQFINHGIIGANSATSDMTIKGTLVSDGVLRGYGGGSNGQLVIDGNANVNGSIASATNALPNEEFTVLRANAINGTLENSTTPYTATGMLNTIGKVTGNEIKVQTTAANNLGPIDNTQQQAYDAMTDMQMYLSAKGDSRVNEMRPLYSMDSNEAKEALTAIASSPVPNTMNLIQRNTMNSHIITSRLSEAFARKDVEVAVPTAGLDGDDNSKNPTMKMKLDQPVDNDFWFKVARNWGDGTGSSYYQGTTLAGGWDRAYGKNWRAGAFISYGQFSFADNLSHDDVKDTRLGLYGGYSNGPHNGYVYLDYGWIKNDLTRQLTGLALQAKANYNSRILELGGEYKYDLNAKNMKVWHISPYANMQLSQLWQDGYTEGGAGIFGQRVDSKSNTYFAGGLGIEFKRYLSNGSYGMRLGVKHAFAGSDPKLTYGYVGDTTHSYELRGQNDKTHFVMSLGGEAEFAPGWTLAGDLAFQKGSHDKDIMAAVTLRRMW
ncbi:hypothetical protein D081_2300 [Anaerovibrio sp. JC8]|uniref:autotransporter outer membrane beta-barrel domain-containing protein n=1 Tax=Anaerovibrio sp. JC8 TaxID=1240085 RepID=UPI000A0E0391|nr:autotransporter outer membrane beta-barrel domain-containing protein [Anaerovibrio sp. JC8]ORT98935.1 hypothetical protein D081_2300 [Anaerovibrio sp. JC8]